jgi:ribose transport system substrate-binding protein
MRPAQPASGPADPFMQGCIGTIGAIRHLRKLPVRQEVVHKPYVIDKSNFAEFDKTVEARNCPRWEEIEKAN